MPFDVTQKPTTAVILRRTQAHVSAQVLTSMGLSHCQSFRVLSHQFNFTDLFFPGFIKRLHNILASISDEAGQDLVEKAFYIAWVGHEKKFRDSGEIYFEHPLAVAEWAAQVGLNAEEIATALCHDLVEDKCLTIEYIQDQLGKTVADLIDGVTKLGKEQGYAGAEPSPAARLQKKLKAGIRPIIVGLGDRLHNMRTLQYKLSDGENGLTDQEKRQAIARETLSVHVPLANRFGLWEIKRELEDLAFKYLEPELFAQIEAKQKDLRTISEAMISDIRTSLLQRLTALEVVPETRSIYELYQRMQQHRIPLAALSPSDIWRLNINVIESDANLVCYEALQDLDQLYHQARPEEHRRYLGRNARPNGHEFIHNWIDAPDFGPLLTQIRDAKMWERNRRGVLTDPNWREAKRAELEDLVGLLGEEGVDEQTAYEMIVGIGEIIKVETPKGEIMGIPAGATVLDFAFTIHRRQALKTISAKVNGEPADLSRVLQPDDRVEIVWPKNEDAPNKAISQWLEWVHTEASRLALTKYLSKRSRAVNMTEGKQLLHKALEKYFVPVLKLLSSGLLVKYLGAFGTYTERPEIGKPRQVPYTQNPEQFLAEIGAGERSVRRVVADLVKIFSTEKAENLSSKGWQETPYFICFKAKDMPGEKVLYATDFSRLGFNIAYEDQVPLSGGVALIILGVNVFGGTERKEGTQGVGRGRGGLVGQIQRIQVETIAAKYALPESITEKTGRVIILTEEEATAYLEGQKKLTAGLAARLH